MATKTVHRSSDTGKFISRKTADRLDPRTWEKERVKVGKK